MSGCLDAWMHGCLDAWMHGCMDAWMHGCMDAWMHAWVVVECLFTRMLLSCRMAMASLSGPGRTFKTTRWLAARCSGTFSCTASMPSCTYAACRASATHRSVCVATERWRTKARARKYCPFLYLSLSLPPPPPPPPPLPPTLFYYSASLCSYVPPPQLPCSLLSLSQDAKHLLCGCGERPVRCQTSSWRSAVLTLAA